jgi:hypothetical protein
MADSAKKAARKEQVPVLELEDRKNVKKRAAGPQLLLSKARVKRPETVIPLLLVFQKRGQEVGHDTGNPR